MPMPARCIAKMQSQGGEGCAYPCATVYAQWGDAARVLDLLEAAQRARDGALEIFKVDPLRADARFQALVRQVGFP